MSQKALQGRMRVVGRHWVSEEGSEGIVGLSEEGRKALQG